MSLERMSDFFAARADVYDEHMLNNVEGCKEGYAKLAELLPKDINTLLDLGCGTGLVLDEILKVMPNIKVTGIDMTKEMLDKLKEKHSDKNIRLINADFLEYDLGTEKYDAVVSFQAMHHFSRSEKIKLYKRIFDCIKSKGFYIEGDYMVSYQKDEDDMRYDYEMQLRTMPHTDSVLYHFDIPFTVENQIDMLTSAGFSDVKMIWKMGNTAIIVSCK